MGTPSKAGMSLPYPQQERVVARWPARASARGVQPMSMPEGVSARLKEGRRSPPKGLSYPLIPRPEGCFFL